MKSKNDVILNLATKIIIFPLAILVSVITARILEPSGKGALAYLRLVTALIVAIGSLGFPTGVIYYVASHKYKVHEVYLSLCVVSFGFAIPYAYLLWAAYTYQLIPLSVDRIEFLYLMMATLPFSFLALFYSRLLIATSSFKKANLHILLSAILPLLTLFPLLLFSSDKLAGAAISLPIIDLLATLVALFLTWPKEAPIKRLNIPFIKDCFLFGLRAAVGNIALRANFRFDQYVLGTVAASSQLGYYSVSASMSEILWYITDSVGLVLAPKISGMQDQKQARDITNRLFRLLFWGSILLGIAMIAFGGSIITLLYGPDYTPSIPVFYVLIIASVSYLGAKVFSKYLTGSGHPGKVSTAQVIGAILSIALYITLIPRQGMMGAAWATVFGYFGASLVMWHFYRMETKSTIWDILIITPEDIVYIRSVLKALVNQFKIQIENFKQTNKQI